MQAEPQSSVVDAGIWHTQKCAGCKDPLGGFTQQRRARILQTVAGTMKRLFSCVCISVMRFMHITALQYHSIFKESFYNSNVLLWCVGNQFS